MADSSVATELSQDGGNIPRVLFIVGSLRKESFNKQMGEYAASLLEGRAHTKFLEWDDIPLMNQDIEFPTPDPVKRIRQAVTEADALWIVTPEYNHGVPGTLKNVIDWLSRPLEDGSQAVIIGKTVTVSGVSGISATRYADACWLPTFDFLKMNVVPGTWCGSALDSKEFSTNVLHLTEAEKGLLKQQADLLLKEIADYVR